ncbi:MAG: mechanosensitive ion channel family protein, partial [Phycisphaerales bacterium]
MHRVSSSAIKHLTATLVLLLVTAALPDAQAHAAYQDQSQTTLPAAAPETEPPPLTAEEQEALARQALARIQGLENPQAEIVDGALVISGIADDTAIISQATNAARTATGIEQIDNQIELSLNLQDRSRGAASRVSQRAEVWISYLPLIPLALAILLAFIFFAWVTGKLSWPFRHFTRNPFLQDILRKITQTAILLIGVLLALEVLDAMALVGGVLGAAGVAGIAIGFAFKDLIENYIASVLLSLRQPFRPKDHVVIDGHEGLITSMNTRTTVLTTFDGNIVRIPNAIVFKTTLINYTTDPRRRFDFTVGVGYDVPLSKALEIGLDTVLKADGVLQQPAPFANVSKLGDSSVSIQFFGWADQSKNDFGKVRTNAMIQVKGEFQRLEIDMPEPIYKIRFEGEPPRVQTDPQRPTRAAPTPMPTPGVESPAADTSPDITIT